MGDESVFTIEINAVRGLLSNDNRIAPSVGYQLEGEGQGRGA
jgi:hypothetical protein